MSAGVLEAQGGLSEPEQPPPGSKGSHCSLPVPSGAESEAGDLGTLSDYESDRDVPHVASDLVYARECAAECAVPAEQPQKEVNCQSVRRHDVQDIQGCDGRSIRLGRILLRCEGS